MAEAKVAGKGSSTAGGGSPGGRGRPVWVSSLPSNHEIEALRRRYPEVVSVPEEALVAESELWARTAVVARSLGRRVAIEAVVRELRRRLGMRGEIMGSYVDKGLFVLRFSEPADRDKALMSPWTVAGQALALEPWRPRWFPSEEAVTTALVWVRLPSLPVEYWAREALREILRPAGELVAVDDWTETRRRLGFARVCLRISLGQPLRQGVLIQMLGGCFWQSFVHENLEGVCFSCGRFHGPDQCPGGSGRLQEGAISAANLMQQSGEGGEEVQEGPLLGTWALAVRRWSPEMERGKAAEATFPPRRPGKEPLFQSMSQGQVEGELRKESDHWVMPSKVARRNPSLRQPAKEAEGVFKGDMARR